MSALPDTVALFAPAKINLNLQVCGKRSDGYHILDSLVVFAGTGDVVTAKHDKDLHLVLRGPFARVLAADEDNLVVKAARALASHTGRVPAAHLTLEKRLPIASGIGGGSSDAAATLLACARLWGVDASTMHSSQITASLGADVPVCLARAPTRMRGIGDELMALADLPPAWLVLINPGRPLATKAVFAALAGRHSGPLPPPPAFAEIGALTAYLATTRNDLMAPARTLMPEIDRVLQALEGAEGCLLARLSGSGPTCFGLFATAEAARRAAAAITAVQHGWWVMPAPLLGAGDPMLALP